MTRKLTDAEGMVASRAHSRRREWSWVEDAAHGALAHLDGRALLFSSDRLARKAAFGLLDRVTVVRIGKKYGLSGPTSWVKRNPRASFSIVVADDVSHISRQLALDGHPDARWLLAQGAGLTDTVAREKWIVVARAYLSAKWRPSRKALAEQVAPALATERERGRATSVGRARSNPTSRDIATRYAPGTMLRLFNRYGEIGTWRTDGSLLRAVDVPHTSVGMTFRDWLNFVWVRRGNSVPADMSSFIVRAEVAHSGASKLNPARRNGELVQFPTRTPVVPAAPASSTRDRDAATLAAALADYLSKHARHGITAAQMAHDLSIPLEAAELTLDHVEGKGLLTSVKTVIKGTKVYRAPVARGPFVEHHTPTAQERQEDRERSRRVRTEADERASTQARYKVNDVVVFRGRGGRRRYVVTVVEPNYGGEQSYYLVALSGGERGSAPSGVRESEIARSPNQTLAWEGVVGHKLKARYVSMGGLLAGTPEKAKAAWESARQVAISAPVTVAPGIDLARRVRYSFPVGGGAFARYRGVGVQVPSGGRKKGVVWVAVPMKPIEDYAKRLWHAVETLMGRGLIVNNVEAGLGRIVVVADGQQMPSERMWKEMARAARMSGEKVSDEELRNPRRARHRA